MPGLPASIGVTRSYSGRLFLCALVSNRCEYTYTVLNIAQKQFSHSTRDLSNGPDNKSITQIVKHIESVCITLAQNRLRNLQTKETLGTGHLSLVERVSSSQKFSFKPIRKSLKTKKLTHLQNVLL